MKLSLPLALSIALILAVCGCTTVAPSESSGSSSGGSSGSSSGGGSSSSSGSSGSSSSSSGFAGETGFFGIFTQAHATSFQYNQENKESVPYGGKLGAWGSSSIGTDDTSDIPSVAGCQKSLVFTITNYDGGVFWIFCTNTNTLAPADVDMSKYANGKIHFWIKIPSTPVDLQIKLESVTNSVAEAVFLSGYINIEESANTWKEVIIPISDFISKASKPDFTKLNVLIGFHEGKGTYKLAEFYYTEN